MHTMLGKAKYSFPYRATSSFILFIIFLSFLLLYFLLTCFAFSQYHKNSLTKSLNNNKYPSKHQPASESGPVSLDFLRSVPKSNPDPSSNGGTYKYQMRRRLVILPNLSCTQHTLY